MKALIVALLLVATVPATAQQRRGITETPAATPQSNFMDFGPSRTIKLYDKDKTTQIATATISRWGIYFRDMDGKHIATLARKPDNTVGAWDPHGNPIDPTVLPSFK